MVEVKDKDGNVIGYDMPYSEEEIAEIEEMLSHPPIATIRRRSRLLTLVRLLKDRQAIAGSATLVAFLGQSVSLRVESYERACRLCH